MTRDDFIKLLTPIRSSTSDLFSLQTEAIIGEVELEEQDTVIIHDWQCKLEHRQGHSRALLKEMSEAFGYIEVVSISREGVAGYPSPVPFWEQMFKEGLVCSLEYMMDEEEEAA